MIRTPKPSLPRAPVQSLTRDLRSHKSSSMVGGGGDIYIYRPYHGFNNALLVELAGE